MAEDKHVHDGYQVPPGAPLPELVPRPTEVMCGVILDHKTTSRLKYQGRELEQACDLYKKKKRKAKCDRRSPACASCKSHEAECLLRKDTRRRKRQEKKPTRRGVLDRMAERIERIECMLRQRGLLKDGGSKTEVMGENLEGTIQDIRKDVFSVPGLCRTGLDCTIQPGFALTGATKTDKSGALSYVEKWLETLPTVIKLAPPAAY